MTLPRERRSRHALTLFLATLGLLAAVHACGGGGDGGTGPIGMNPPPSPPGPPAPAPPGPSPAPPGPPPPPPPAPPGPGGNVVSVGNLSETFAPPMLVVARGARVTWRWTDGVTHTTTSDSNVWNSGLRFGTGTQFSFQFNTAGSFPYHCQVHGAAGGVGMSGTITVTP